MSHADREAPELSIDEFGVLRYDNRWVALAPAERTVMELLLSSFGLVVSRNELSLAVWPSKTPDPSRRSIHVVVFRLRKRIEPLGLAISTIRTHGFLLHWKGVAHA